MTVEDAFDARLKAAFAAAEPKPAPAFEDRVMARLGAPSRRRLLIIGGAGAGGSTIASTQLEELIRYAESATGASSWLSDGARMAGVLQPETLAAVALAAMVAMLAFVLPSRN